jgi:aryl-alcohol dehydrogenase-like predicted oxidoreductase
MYTWEFARLQYIARSNGWTEFISMQPFYNLLYREEEREMLPFCRASGVGVIPWSPIARGLLAKPLQKENDEGGSLRSRVDEKTDRWFADANLDIVNRVEEIAKKKGVSMALVSTAWVLQQGCCPIIGLSSEARITETLGALKVKLTDEECKYLESEYRPRGIQGM